MSEAKPGKGSSGNSQWSWKDVHPRLAGSDSDSALFKLHYLDCLQEVFLFREYEKNGLTPTQSLDTESQVLRVHFIGMENTALDIHVFIRNENSEGVFNWSIGCRPSACPILGDFVDFSAKKYQADYGGFLADIFAIYDQSLISAGFGTNASSNYTTANTLIYSIPNTPLTYIELRLANIARFAFVLQTGRLKNLKEKE